MTPETREEFLARVDETNTPHEQALFIAISMLEVISEGTTSNSQRMAKLCLRSIDDRLLER